MNFVHAHYGWPSAVGSMVILIAYLLHRIAGPGMGPTRAENGKVHESGWQVEVPYY